MYLKIAAAALIIASFLFISMQATAHHSVAANFDQTKSVDVVGKVKSVEIRNPHSQITLEVPKPGGGVNDFYVEWSDKNALMRRKVPVSKIHVGDKVRSEERRVGKECRYRWWVSGKQKSRLR